jgi:ribosomal protein S21
MLVWVNGNLKRAIKTLKNRLAKDGLMAELKMREGFLSRSERRKEKSARAEKRRNKHKRK